MSHARSISRSAWILLAMSALVAVAGLALPLLRPGPTGLDPDLIALRSEHAALARNDDTTLENLRQLAKAQPSAAWSVETFIERVGPGWRVEWPQPDGTSRSVLLSRSDPRLHQWPDYLRFVKSWTDQPGIILESLEVSATSTAATRELAQVVIGLRITLTGAPIRNAERDAPSRVPLPVAAADDAAMTRKIGPGPSLRRPVASAQPPAPGPASAPVRPDPPGPRAAVFPSVP